MFCLLAEPNTCTRRRQSRETLWLAGASRISGQPPLLSSACSYRSSHPSNDHGILGRIGDEIDVLQRIAVNQQKVCEGGDLHYAELASIRTVFPHKASNSALVDVAMTRALAGVYQRTREARIAPSLRKRTRDNTSIPHAVLTCISLRGHMF